MSETSTKTESTQEEGIRSLSTLLEDFVNDINTPQVSIKQILDAFHERGIGILLLIFAAPMALPVPVPPGINVALASPLLLLTAQQAWGAHAAWFPESIKKKEFKAEKVKGLFGGIIPWLRKIEILTRPRLGFMTRDGASRFCGVLGVIMALTVCIPLPLTNTVPSFGIALMSIGVMMRDGLAVMAGALIGTAWVVMLALAVFVFGPEAFDIIKETIKSWI